MSVSWYIILIHHYLPVLSATINFDAIRILILIYKIILFYELIENKLTSRVGDSDSDRLFFLMERDFDGTGYKVTD